MLKCNTKLDSAKRQYLEKMVTSLGFWIQNGKQGVCLDANEVPGKRVSSVLQSRTHALLSF